MCLFKMINMLFLVLVCSSVLLAQNDDGLNETFRLVEVALQHDDSTDTIYPFQQANEGRLQTLLLL